MICFLSFCYNISDFCYKNTDNANCCVLASPWIHLTAEHPKTQSSRRKQGLLIGYWRPDPSFDSQRVDLSTKKRNEICSQVSPLHYAARHNHLPVLQTLVEIISQLLSKCFYVDFFYTCEVRLFLSLPPGWLRCQHQCERQRQSDPPALCCQVNIDPPDDQLLSSLSTLVCNLYRFKISAGANESKNVKTGLVSTYISDQSIKRVLDISETLWLNHNRMSWRQHLRK